MIPRSVIIDTVLDHPNTSLSLITKVGGIYNEDIPEDYQVIGIIQTLQVGACFRVLRLANSKGKTLGNFMTSEVVEIQNNLVKTKNSTYKIETL